MSKKGAKVGNGAGKTNQRAKDQAMAARMKFLGTTRGSGRCPICYQIISLSKFQNHISTHK